jgi:hypothetical protein
MSVQRFHSLSPATLLARVLAACLGTFLCTAGHAQVVQSKLVPNDGDPNDEFGGDVAFSSGWAFATADLDDDVQAQSGAVYVHQLLGDQWVFTQKLKAPTPGFSDQFGYSIATSGDWMVTGAWQADPGGMQSAGEAHVFMRQGAIWIHTQVLVASDFASGLTERFGEVAAMDGNVMLIGMPEDNFKTFGSGSVYVFELQGQTWVETAKLAPAAPVDWEIEAGFGTSMDVSGTRLVIGAPFLDNGLGTDRGAAFVFEQSGSAWVQTQKLLPSDAANLNYFGAASAVDGDSILIGAAEHQHTPPPNIKGAVYVFTKQGPAWSQTQELAPTDPWNPLSFGRSVDVEGDLAVVTAGADADLGSLSGSAYAFRRVGGSWEQFGKLLAPDGKNGDVVGVDVGVSGTRVLLGAFGDDDGCGDQWNCNTGAAYVFNLSPHTQQYSSCLGSGICGNHDDHGGCANSSGQGAVLAAGGSTSTSADSLCLEARWLPQGVFGILFMGGSQNWLPFGDGRLAVGPGATGIFRLLPPKNSGSAGALIWNGGIVAQSQTFGPPGHIDPGETWYFQAWYRDPTGPCGTGFNVSNGLQVDFTP